MTDDTQPEAMDLADWLEAVGGGGLSPNRCAALPREQHARIAELESELEAVGAGGVSGPLIGQPQAMPDLSVLTERGAKAWAGVDAQALREGGAADHTEQSLEMVGSDTDMCKEREAFEAWALAQKLGEYTEQMGFRFFDAGDG